MSGPSTPKLPAAYARPDARDVLARTRDAYARLDGEFRFVDVNPAAERALGVSREALVGRTHWEVFPASLGTPVEAAYRRVAAEGGEAHLAHHYTGEGRDAHVEIDVYGTAPAGEVDVFWRDVSERVRADGAVRAAYGALAEREREFRAMVDGMPTLAWTARADGYIDWYNARWYAYTGTTADDMAGWGWQSVHDPDALPLVLERWRASIATGATFEMTFPLRGADGVFRPFLTRVAPVVDGAGRVTRWFGTNTDLTPERAAAAERERLLAESQAARAELEAANLLLQEQGLELELSNQQLHDQAVELEVQAEELQAVAVQLEARTVEAEARAAALRAGDARYRALLASIDAGFCVLEVLFEGAGADAGRAVDVRYLETNPAFVRQAGFDPVGRRMREIAPDHEAFWFEAFGRVAVTGVPVRLRNEAVALGRVYDVFAYRVDAPALRRVAVLFTDVTADEQAGRERERLLAVSEAERARAVEANAAKAQFLANMSHELRTPLNAIAGYAQLLDMGLHGPVTDAQHEALGRLQRAQQHLLGLINDVLNYARVESGRVEYDLRAVGVAEVVDDVAPMLAPQMAAKRIAFTIEALEVLEAAEAGLDGAAADGAAAAPGAAPLAVWADRDKLRQVLLNLLSNAVKFTDAGGRVTVGVVAGRPGAEGGADVVHLRVTDTGRGIAREKQEAVFEPFVQVGKQFAGESAGTGLGLAISRDLARGMGGDLRVRSAPGEGATFTVTLRRAPLGAADDGAAGDGAAGDGAADAPAF